MNKYYVQYGRARYKGNMFRFYSTSNSSMGFNPKVTFQLSLVYEE